MINQRLPANTRAVNRMATPGCIRAFDDRALISCSSTSAQAYASQSKELQIRCWMAEHKCRVLPTSPAAPPGWAHGRVSSYILNMADYLSGASQWHRSVTLHGRHRVGVAVASTVRQGFSTPSTCFVVPLNFAAAHHQSAAVLPSWATVSCSSEVRKRRLSAPCSSTLLQRAAR